MRDKNRNRGVIERKEGEEEKNTQGSKEANKRADEGMRRDGNGWVDARNHEPAAARQIAAINKKQVSTYRHDG